MIPGSFFEMLFLHLRVAYLTLDSKSNFNPDLKYEKKLIVTLTI